MQTTFTVFSATSPWIPHSHILTSSNSYLSFCFIASFAFVLQKAQGLAHAPYFCRAGVYSRRLIGINPSSRREQAPALRCNPIITQIGRENKFSADIYVSRTVEDAGPYNL